MIELLEEICDLEGRWEPPLAREVCVLLRKLANKVEEQEHEIEILKSIIIP